jgi:penicillin-binding protein 2
MGAQYLAEQQKGSSRTQVIKAARGEIVDRNGSPFAYNQSSYSIQLDRALSSPQKDNDTILWLVNVLRGTGEKWIDNLPIEVNGDSVSFTGDEDSVAKLRKFLTPTSTLRPRISSSG